VTASPPAVESQREWTKALFMNYRFEQGIAD